MSPDEWEIRQYKGATDKDRIEKLFNIRFMDSIIRVKAARRIKKYNMSKAK